ncbi:MAG TPA: YbhN family protein [Solirubrobacteraceae bacterium]|nr:YbhN family protein [Solirubrobacteraceae bacterium]
MRRGLRPCDAVGAIARRIAGLVLCALVLYGVAPAVLGVLDAWPQVVDIEPYWFAAMIAAQVASWAGMWLLQRLAVDVRSWWPVITSNLAAGALGRVVPGGSAAAGALQFRMLVQAGVPPSFAGLGIGVASIVVLAALAALPVLALPPVLLGVAVPERLGQAAIGGVALFFALLGVGAVLMAGDRPILAVGRAFVRIGRRVRPRHPPADDLPERFKVQRDLVRRALGSRWWEAVAGAAARWIFDWVTLLTALAAVGQHPRPSLVLLAFCAAQLLAQIPITPGGLGVVEAGLTGALALIGVPAAAAAVATLAYRLVSYWLALPAGGVAWLVHRWRVRAGVTSVPRTART